jgi:hypothetical protein
MVGTNVSGFASGAAPPAASALYGASGGVNTTSDLYTIDTTTGAGTSIGAIGFGITGLAFRPSDDVLFGVTNNNSASNPRALVTIDTVTGAGTLVGALGVANGIADISFRSDDALYGYAPTNRTLYSINTSTGAATQVSATAIPTSGFGYGDAFDSGDILYVFPKGTAGAFYIVDPATGGLTAQTALSGTAFTNGIINAAAFDVDDLAWVSVISSGPVWDIGTIDVGSSSIAGVGSTVSNLDALAWGPA